jgi:hypothetical protein
LSLFWGVLRNEKLRFTLFIACIVVKKITNWTPNSVNYQLDTQFFYFIMHLLQSSTCFEQRRAHHQEVKLY